MKIKRFHYYFKLYLTTLFIFASYFLVQKYNNPVEWTISEWLINYQGGFTRRGLIGDIIYKLNKSLNFTFRELILVLQILSYLIYYSLIYSYIKNLKINHL